MKHKHYDCIVAFANGEQIQYRAYEKDEWEDIDNPSFMKNCQYRIKKEPVIEVKYFYKDSINYGVYLYAEFTPDLEPWDLKITYQDGKEIKVELPE